MNAGKILLVTCWLTMSCYSMEPDEVGTPVIAFNSEFFSEKATTSSVVAKALVVGPKLFWKRPLTAAYLAKDKDKIAEKAEDIAKETHGTVNVTHRLFKWLEQEGYGTFSDNDIKEISKISIQPSIKPAELALIKLLREHEVSLLCMTNQDDQHHVIFRDHLRDAHKECFASLFDASITVPSFECSAFQTDGIVYHKPLRDLYIAREPRPKESYQQTVRWAADELSRPNCPVLLFDTDERHARAMDGQKENMSAFHAHSIQHIIEILQTKKVLDEEQASEILASLTEQKLLK